MDQENPVAQQAEPPAPEPPRKTKRKILVLALLLAAIGAGIWYYRQALPFEKTDNAFIDARIEQIAPRISGPVVELLVNDNQVVHKDDPIAS